MNNNEARQWLDAVWRKAVEAGVTDPDPEIDRLANSKVVAIRYALVTQMLGKVANPDRSLLIIQLAAGGGGAWDPRSFSTAVVVPWVSDNHNVLGTSAEPYASKPLRRPRLEKFMDNVRSKPEWEALVDFLTRLEEASPEELKSAFVRVMASLVRRLAQQTFTYPVPQRISLPQLQDMVAKFLSVSSGGLRPLAVSAALFKTLGEGFSLFDDVRSQGVNEADTATGMPGDIICRNAGEVCLVVEVKDLDLTLTHVKTATRKAKESEGGLLNLLFAVPGVQVQDRDEIEALMQHNWATGLNIYSVDILRLSNCSFTLLGEEWRVRFVREICNELDRRQDQLARKAWHDLLLGNY